MSSEQPVPYFTLPANALKSLFDEIRISMEEDVAEEIIERYGLRCGEGLIKNMEIHSEDLKAFGDVVHPLWAHVGMGRPKVKEVSNDAIIVEFYESIEAIAKGRSEKTKCTFSRGYLKGMVQEATGADFEVKETTCLALGDEICTYEISPLKKEDVFIPDEDLPTLEPMAEAQYELNRGYCYLVVDEDQSLAYNVFKDLVVQGNEGFCVTRSFPTKILKTYGIKVPILWLTKEQGEGTLVPHNLAKLNFLIEEFIKKEGETAVILDGLEYLITHNNYEPILRFLQLLNDKIAITNSIMVLPVNPFTLDQRHLKLLEREMEVFNPDKHKK